jgi:hypothetical protein
MTELNPQTLRRDQLLEAAVSRQLDPLVRQATAAALLLKGKERMEENQLRNLLNVAVESRSVEVVVNFIRYQIARNGNAWGTGQGEFGHRVIEDLRTTVRSYADDAAGYVRERMPEAPDAGQLFGDAYVRLMQLYLGYLNRAFIYGKKTNDFDRLKEVPGVS